MILNGLGFTSEPLYLSPEFFSDKPLSNLFDRNDIEASNFNARKLSDSLDDVYKYGLEKMFSELSVSACTIENINTGFTSLDTTSLSLTGQYDQSTDEHELQISHGFSKDKRPDLKQIVHELLVSQDGGIPLMSKSWSGNASDSKIFQERVKDIVNQFDKDAFSKVLVADSKLYNANNAVNLSGLSFITRIPSSIKKTIDSIDDALSKDKWIKIDEENKYYVVKIKHYDIEQRWIVVYSSAANSRASKRVQKKITAEKTLIKQKVNNVNKMKLTSESDTTNAIENLIKSLFFHSLTYTITLHEGETPEASYYSVKYELKELLNAVSTYISRKSCYVVGSNISPDTLKSIDVVNRYKMQNSSIENMGFRFLKDPQMFTSSLFVKLPRRIESLLFIMTLSLLVYAIAQRKIRNALKDNNISIPNQLKHSTQAPTMKWVFKLLKGINVVCACVDNKAQKIVQGITKLKSTIIDLFGSSARKIYGFQT